LNFHAGYRASVVVCIMPDNLKHIRRAAPRQNVTPQKLA